jgi:hypothetical protein
MFLTKTWRGLALAVLLVAAGACSSTGPAGADSGPPGDAAAEHRDALAAFEQGRYNECIGLLASWLATHRHEHPRLAPSARFYIALSYREQGQTDKARAAFRDIVRRYAQAPAAHPAAKWRDWARKEYLALSE